MNCDSCNSNNCIQCFTNYFLDSNNSCVVSSSCPVSTFADSSTGTCKNCSLKYLNCELCNSTECSKCLTNYFLDNNKSCLTSTSCPTSTFADIDTGTC